MKTIISICGPRRNCGYDKNQAICDPPLLNITHPGAKNNLKQNLMNMYVFIEEENSIFKAYGSKLLQNSRKVASKNLMEMIQVGPQ